MTEASPSKIRAGVKPMSLSALSGDYSAPSASATQTPPPEPVGGDSVASNNDDHVPPAAATSARSPQQQQQQRSSSSPTPQQPPPVATYGHFPMPGQTPVRSPGSLSNGPGGITPPLPAGGTPTHFGGVGASSAQGMNLPSPSGLTETEYLHTRNLVPHVQQRALVAVMQSLIDDFPSLTPVIRIRCEKAMAFVMAQQQREASLATVNGPQIGNSSAGQREGSNQHRAGSTPPGDNLGPGITPPGSCTKSGKRSLAGSVNRREQEEQERCGVHGNMRAAKHLQYSLTTQRWECIPGFHCLVDNTATLERLSSPPPAPVFTASSNTNPTSRTASMAATPNEGNTPLPQPSPVKANLPARRNSSSQPLLGGASPHGGVSASEGGSPQLGIGSGVGSSSTHGLSGDNHAAGGAESGTAGADRAGSSPTAAVDVDRLTSLLDALKE